MNNFNELFRREYKKYFKKSLSDYIPHINDFINEPPTEEEQEFYIFLEIF